MDLGMVRDVEEVSLRNGVWDDVVGANFRLAKAQHKDLFEFQSTA